MVDIGYRNRLFGSLLHANLLEIDAQLNTTYIEVNFHNTQPQTPTDETILHQN